MTTLASKRILVISDDTKGVLQSRIDESLSPRAYELMTTRLRGNGLEIAIAELMPDLTIIDVSLSLLEKGLLTGLLIRMMSTAPILFLSAGKEGTLRLVEMRNANCLSTPFDVSMLGSMIEDVLYKDIGRAS